MALTQKEITGLKPKNSSYYTWDDDRTKGTGRLGVKTQPSSSKTFVFRYYRNGQRTFMVLGKFPEMSLSTARDKAKQLGAMLVEGLDPKDELEASRKAVEQTKRQEALIGSIKQLFNAHAAQKQRDGKRNWQSDLADLEKYVYPQIPPETKAKNIEPAHIIPILSEMIQRGATIKSNRLRSHLMAAFNYGLRHDNDPMNYAGAKFGLKYNPIQAIPKQSHAEKVGDHFLTFSEVKIVLSDMQNRFDDLRMSGQVRNLIQLCFFTGGQRPYELCASRWEHVNWENHTLTISPDIFKAKRAHVIPLIQSALTILKDQREQNLNESPFIFFKANSPTEHLPTNTLAQAIDRYRKKTEIRPFVPRDIRRTFKTLGGEIGLSKHVRDQIQGHALNDVSSRHYDRYEYLAEKRKALEIWEQHLVEQINENIVSFKG